MTFKLVSVKNILGCLSFAQSWPLRRWSILASFHLRWRLGHSLFDCTSPSLSQQ